MRDIALIDSNVLLLLIIGTAAQDGIREHKRLGNFSIGNYNFLIDYLDLFEEIICIPHILAETSNLSFYSRSIPRLPLATAFRTFLDDFGELLMSSQTGMQRIEFPELGLTDSMILAMLDNQPDDCEITLISSDQKLINRARSLGHNVLDVLAEAH